MEDQALGIIIVGIYFFFGVIYILYILSYFLEIAVTLAHYILQGLGIMKSAQKSGIRHGWFSFIPFAASYLLGEMAEKDDEVYGNGKKRPWAKIMLGAKICAAALYLLVLIAFFATYFIFMLISIYNGEGFTGGVGMIFCIGNIPMILLLMAALLVYLVIVYFVTYKVYHVMAGDHAWWMLLLSIFCAPLADTVIWMVLGFHKDFPTYLKDTDAATDIPTEHPAEDISPAE